MLEIRPHRGRRLAGGLIGGLGSPASMVTPVRQHTRFEKARIIGARALQISMGAPLYVSEDELRENFMEELVQLWNRRRSSKIRT